MKRIAGNIAKAFLNTFNGQNECTVSDSTRYYASNPRNSRVEVPDNSRNEEGVNSREGNTLDRAYAPGSQSAEIQYC